jgi:hypothetical protein
LSLAKRTPEAIVSDPISRRAFALAAAVSLGGAVHLSAADKPKDDKPKDDKPAEPTEAKFERDYDAPKFKPSWKKQQINRQLVQDFVIFAHFDLAMVKKLLEKEPALVNATMDWGGGDWETGLGGASHVGNREVAAFLLEKGARIDIFCAAMMGQLEAVKAFLTLEPKLIDAKGPHGFSLHWHAKVGGKQAEKVLDHLQSIKKVDFTPKKKDKDDKKDK